MAATPTLWTLGVAQSRPCQHGHNCIHFLYPMGFLQRPIKGMEMDSLLDYLANDGLSICKQTPATNPLQVIKSEWPLLDQVPPGVDGPH